jgi:hypothetical protein
MRPNKSSSLWAMDAALLIFGLMVLLLVLRLLRFDDPNPFYNAWLYLLGVPTILIATSMLSRVLTNDWIEKSIQFGFLLSVGLHLLLMIFAVNVVLFTGPFPSDQRKDGGASASQPSTMPQYFQPSNSKMPSRPDYLKPVETVQSEALPTLDPSQRPDESAKLSIDVMKDELKPTLSDKPFNKPRREASPSQPSIASTAEKLGRPDITKPLDPQTNEIDIPNLQSTQPTPSLELKAAAADMGREDIQSISGTSLADMPKAKMEIESRSNQGSQAGMLRSDAIRDETQRNRELEKSLNRAASDLPERPSLLQRGTTDTSPIDKPMAANVPIPKLGNLSAKTASDNPSARNTDMRSRSNDSRASTRQSVDMANLNGVSGLEPSLGRTAPNLGQGYSAKDNSSAILSDKTFLADPRLARNDLSGGRRPDQQVGESLSAPAAGQAVPNVGGAVVPLSGSNADGGLSQAMSPRSDLQKSDVRNLSSGDKGRGGQGSQASLSPTLGTPSMGSGRDAWAAPNLDIPRKGLDPIKREIAMPEIREADITIDRFRRPEIGGPKIASSAVPIPAPAFSQRLKRNREQDDSAADLGPLGPQTELAIENGLEFLARYQRADGSWHLEDFGEKVDIRSETAATALALLSFQGAGYTHRQFKYESVCGRALTWMIQNQRPNGDLYVRTDPASDSNAWLYSHSIATLALCEAYGMTQDESIKQNAQRAINFLIQSQDPQGGGWRYQPKIGSDTSVTGWCMMALKSAELSGLQVSKESYRGISKWLEGSQAGENQKYLYRYNWQAADTPAARHGRVPTPVMTSVGLLMRLYLGWRRDHPDMQRGTDWLVERLPVEGTVQNPQRDTYYWYYATQVMFHMGGERWKSWYGSLYPMLVRTQKKDGEYVGSWEPNGRIPDAWGRFGGRLYVTTLNLLSLEVYYRHLPIYDATAD